MNIKIEKAPSKIYLELAPSEDRVSKLTWRPMKMQSKNTSTSLNNRSCWLDDVT
jgi:hypothetical protein